MAFRLFSRKKYGRKGSIRMAGTRGKVGLIIGLLLLVTAVICGIVFLPKLFSGPAQSPAASNLVDSSLTAITGKVEDRSELQNEAVIKHSAINDPVMWGDEIVYSTRVTSHLYDKLFIYNIANKSVAQIEVPSKYSNIVWTQMNESFIVYVDAATSGGGRICVYDRASGAAYVVKEYTFALPQITLDGEFLAFSQQAGDDVDRLYVYNLRTRESLAAKVLIRTPAVSGSVFLDEGILTYAVAYYESDILKSRVVELNLTTGEEVTHEWGRYVYSPKRTGKYIAFSSSSTGLMDNVFLSEDGNMPVLLVEDVANYEMGEGFLAYTKESNIYIYVFSTGKTYRLNSDVSKGLLASVAGKYVCWYDVTSQGDVDIVKYAVVDINSMT